MTLRASPLIALLACAAAAAHAQDYMPRGPAVAPMEFEPEIMLDGPGVTEPDERTPGSPQEQAHRLETALAHAQQRATDADSLFREGILAKVEVEGRALRVIQLQSQLDAVHLVIAISAMQDAQDAFTAHKLDQPGLDTSLAALKSAEDTASASAAQWTKSRLGAALLDLQRKRLLYDEGAGTRREMQLAEDRVVLLGGTVPPAPQSRHAPKVRLNSP